MLVFHYIAWGHYKIAVFNELYEELRSYGIDVAIVHIAATEARRSSPPPLELHRCPYRVLLPGAYEEHSAFKRFSMMMAEIRIVRPDAVIFPGYFDVAYWGALGAARHVGACVGVMVDSTADDHRRFALAERLKSVFVRRCDAVFTYGWAARAYAMSLGAAEEKIFTRCQATDNEAVVAAATIARQARSQASDQSARPKTFLYVGRLAKEKNLDAAIEALATLYSTDSRAAAWGLLMVGDGPERAHLEHLAARLNVPARFTGSVTWKEAAGYYGLGDVLLLPSLSEPWGLVVNEALACGLPVIVSNRCGAALELVRDGRNGFTFDPDIPGRLQEAMARFVSGSVDLSAMASSSRAIIAPYTPRNSAIEMARGIRFMLAERQAASSREPHGL